MDLFVDAANDDVRRLNESSLVFPNPPAGLSKQGLADSAAPLWRVAEYSSRGLPVSDAVVAPLLEILARVTQLHHSVVRCVRECGIDVEKLPGQYLLCTTTATESAACSRDEQVKKERPSRPLWNANSGRRTVDIPGVSPVLASRRESLAQPPTPPAREYFTSCYTSLDAALRDVCGGKKISSVAENAMHALLLSSCAAVSDLPRMGLALEGDSTIVPIGGGAVQQHRSKRSRTEDPEYALPQQYWKSLSPVDSRAPLAVVDAASLHDAAVACDTHLKQVAKLEREIVQSLRAEGIAKSMLSCAKEEEMDPSDPAMRPLVALVVAQFGRVTSSRDMLARAQAQFGETLRNMRLALDAVRDRAWQVQQEESALWSLEAELIREHDAILELRQHCRDIRRTVASIVKKGHNQRT